MSIYRGEDALSRALAACADNEAGSGGHSWGFAVPTDGGIDTGHGLGEIPPAVTSVDGEHQIALAHTRYATRGEVTLENAHPFPVYDDDGEAIAALAHNGTWYQAPDDGHCDSYHIARLLETMYRASPDRDFEELVRRTGEVTGETITVLHRDGRAFCYAGRFTITETDDAVRSSGGRPIPEGRVVEL